MRRWLDRMAAWWLRRRGFQIGERLGVTLVGNCVATGDAEDLRIYNPSRQVAVLHGSSWEEERR